jgi:2-oxoisovalerate dehydrogenase E2 component (dihydrolipoyl transacylase)
MPVTVVMPKLGESVVEGQVERWLKREGERVARDEPLVEVVTAKVSTEVPSPASGVLARILVPEGATVPVGTPIAEIEAEVVAEPAQPAAPAAAALAAAPAGTAQPREEGAGRRFYSPLVRKLAEEYGVDLEQVPGTGSGGRVTRDDVLRYVQARTAAQLAAAPTAAAAPPAGRQDRLVPLTTMRRAIAEHMAASARTIPHVTTLIEVDVTDLVRRREQIRQAWRERHGFELSYVPFVIAAVIEGLRHVPVLNASWTEQGILLRGRINIGVAVALDEGLVVPVIHDADLLPFVELARATHEKITRARAGRLSVPDVEGGTFTVNNTGALGSMLSTPIIPMGQAGIVTMEAITRRVVALDEGTIAIRSMMNMCLSFDHRITDGLGASRFLQAVKQFLETRAPDLAAL